jgi:hypothetical protein
LLRSVAAAELCSIRRFSAGKIGLGPQLLNCSSLRLAAAATAARSCAPTMGSDQSTIGNICNDDQHGQECDDLQPAEPQSADADTRRGKRAELDDHTYHAVAHCRGSKRLL